MRQQKRLLSWLGLISWGDIGELTLYRDRFRQLVIYPKQYPKHLRPFFQDRQQKLFTIAVNTWNNLTDDQRAQWKLAAQRASLRMTGYNLFIALSLIPDDEARQTIARQTSTTLDMA